MTADEAEKVLDDILIAQSLRSDGSGPNLAAVVRQAIKAEREACAQAVLEWMYRPENADQPAWLNGPEIAEFIRSRT